MTQLIDFYFLGLDIDGNIWHYVKYGIQLCGWSYAQPRSCEFEKDFCSCLNVFVLFFAMRKQILSSDS